MELGYWSYYYCSNDPAPQAATYIESFPYHHGHTKTVTFSARSQIIVTTKLTDNKI
jgi:hypothetical protein